MKFTPFPYQPAMVRHLADNDRAALFCSPGLGKTVTTLSALDEKMTDGESRGALIIAPIRVAKVTWPQQIEHWEHSSWMKVAHLRTKEGMKAWNDGSAHVYLVNPEQLQKLVPLLFKGRKSVPVDTIIFDELSLAKSHSSKRFNAIRPYLSMFKQRWGLTGTPVCNDYMDLYAQARLLDDGQRLGRSFHQFRQAHFESDYMGYKWTIRAGSKEKIDAKLSDMCLVMLSEDYLDIPTCATEDVSVPLPPEALTAYKTLEKELLIELENSDVVALNAAVLTNKLLQATSGAVYTEDKTVHHIHDAKIEALKKLRKKHKEPILILTAFKHESARVLEAIKGAVMFHEDLIPQWQRGKIHTFVADPRSLSHGIDGLQRGGRIAVWFSLTYSHETYVQTNARLVRTGQSQDTIIYRLIVSNSIDDAVVEALRTKGDTQSGLMSALKALQRLRST